MGSRDGKVVFYYGRENEEKKEYLTVLRNNL